jgi:hypothetical protein
MGTQRRNIRRAVQRHHAEQRREQAREQALAAIAADPDLTAQFLDLATKACSHCRQIDGHAPLCPTRLPETLQP